LILKHLAAATLIEAHVQQFSTATDIDIDTGNPELIRLRGKRRKYK